MSVRLQKFLAEAGVASRRASELLILGGHVAVNGTAVTQLGSRVDPLADRVFVDGRPVKARRKIYVALHKPAGCISTRHDPLDRPTVLELLPPELRTLYPVGRLDFNTEGLLFLTNDGDFCLKLTHPRFGALRRYHATVDGCVTQEVLARLASGVVESGERLQARRARVLSSGRGRSLVEVDLAEGRNHEVRRLFATQGLTVTRLRRVGIGPIALGRLRPGQWRTLTEPEIKSLLSASSVYENYNSVDFGDGTDRGAHGRVPGREPRGLLRGRSRRRRRELGQPERARPGQSCERGGHATQEG